MGAVMHYKSYGLGVCVCVCVLEPSVGAEVHVGYKSEGLAVCLVSRV